MIPEFVDATEIAVLNARAEIVDSLKSLGPEEQLRHLKMRFAQELVDGAEGLFSSSEPSPAKGSSRAIGVGDPWGVWEWRPLRLSMAEPSRPEPRRSAASALLEWRFGSSSPTGAESLLRLHGADQGGVAEALEKSKGREQRPRSTIQISQSRGLSWMTTSRTTSLWLTSMISLSRRFI